MEVSPRTGEQLAGFLLLPWKIPFGPGPVAYYLGSGQTVGLAFLTCLAEHEGEHR